MKTPGPVFRTRTRDDTQIHETSQASSSVVNLAAARPARARSTGGSAAAALENECQAARTLLDEGYSTEAETRLRSLLKAARQDASLTARACGALSTALIMQGRYREALEAVVAYETQEARAAFDVETAISLQAQIGTAYDYTGDHPKAIALLHSALHTAAEHQLSAQMGAVRLALARAYRTISEYSIARDHSQKALEHYRRLGDWRGLAASYFSIACSDVSEGRYEDGISNFEQSLKLIGDNPAPYMLGKIYANLAGACWFIKRPHDGIGYLEKAIRYYEQTDHKATAALAYNNLGINLTLVGDWPRAQAALERALALASSIEVCSAQVPMILDSIGELLMLRGHLLEAQDHLERAVKLATGHGNKWYTAQALRTLGRCYLELGDLPAASDTGRQALTFAERISDQHGIYEARLLLAELHLLRGEPDECSAQLQKVVARGEEASDLAVMGKACRLRGLLAMARSDLVMAVHHFSRSLSIFELQGDKFRAALAHYELGRAYVAATQKARATEHLERAVKLFREIGAEIKLDQAEEALAALDRAAPGSALEVVALQQLLTLRLIEASSSRELLLRELAAVINQETGARRVIVFEPGDAGQYRVVAFHGCTAAEAARLADRLRDMKSGKKLHDPARDPFIARLHAPSASPAILYIAPRTATALAGGTLLDPLLRVVEMGMEVCALRQGAQVSRTGQEQTAVAEQSLLPGFIHSSPAMMRLVEEIHKIRSSDVTVLATGESGTGKELVARAIHAQSSRRDKAFVPFNCTGVPKELSDAHLFGYRRGAFTGAMNDSPGVIRAAAGGTLFLDEVGDLPLDVQPKLLRFLQEGEIQPLGEQRPVKVDVRIIAATNADLEKLVAEGRFREDLYYRLNVIRLRVPPLRERRAEIPQIVQHYIKHYSAKFNRTGISITPQAVDLLMAHNWPGNVRQLCNEIQRIIARAEDGHVITAEHLSPDLRRTSVPLPANAAQPTALATAGFTTEGMTLAEAQAELERRMITEALRKYKGNISRAARELGLTRRGLYLKLERYQLSATA
jgi:DNA-binding NtrC family response regulator/tetratricopeptide (TPR) repeat protein